MELQTAERTIEVRHRIGELRRLAGVLRLERGGGLRRRGPRLRGLRLALGRRLVAAGLALLDGATARGPATIR